MRVQVAPELRLFLPARARAGGAVDCASDGTATVGHLVQAAGVPLTEAGEVRVGGLVADASDRPGPDDVVVVAVRPRPQPLDGPAALLLDVHLGVLARRLRLLGLDVAYRNDAADDALVAQARDEDRLLLSRDRGLLKRRDVRRAAYVRGDDPDAQLADVLDRFALPLQPWSRCPACGQRLQEVPKAAVLDRLQPGTRRTQERFRECTGCGRVFWRGAHAARLDALVERAVRRSGGGGAGPPR